MTRPPWWLSPFLIVLVLTDPSLQAAEIAVTTFQDERETNGNCSFREAILSANADIAFDGCASGFGADTIRLSAGTYILDIPGAGEDAATTGDLDIDGDLTLIGSDVAATIIDGGGWDRVFHINPSGGIPGSMVSLARITVQNGMALEGHGGAIYQQGGELRLSDITISDNASEGDGGGVEVGDGGVLVVTNSTISGNQAVGGGGGLRFRGTTGDLNNVTVANNAADSRSTGIQGGGLLADEGTLTLRNTIVAGNSDGIGGAPDCAGTLTSAGYNLIRVTTGCTIVGETTGNIIGQDPLLEALAENGGPTATQALKNGSPAIDAGDPTGCKDETGEALSFDQRGLPRGTTRCDIGAVEIACGNGVVEMGEECDDGNTTSGDGCDMGCQGESVSTSGGCGLAKKLLL